MSAVPNRIAENRLDRAIAYVSPGWALRRHRARVLAAAYEAADPGRLRTRHRDYGSGNTAVGLGGAAVRTQARALERNHDLARNAINVLVQNVIGPNGIGVEFQPRTRAGDIDEAVAEQLRTLHAQWCKRPEVTWQHDWASAQRLLGRTWIRDGEALVQELMGRVAGLDHATPVPYALELIEPDLLPFEATDLTRGLLHGVERNAWGRPIAYHLYKQHPGDPSGFVLPESKRVAADRIRHLKLIDRIGQVRGISLFASVLTRLDDLKDYEESERIAAKIAASMAAVIIKGDPNLYPEAGYLDSQGQPMAQRRMRFAPGMVFDDLRPGEDVKTISSDRPNANLEPHRNGQLRAVAGGFGVSFSSLAKNYNGTYSAQRQELVEQYGAYGVLSMEFIHQLARPITERFVAMAYASGQLVLSNDSDPAALTDALYIAPAMPWIDPMREAEALALMEDNVFMSAPEIIRRRGANPRDVLDQESSWQQKLREWGLVRVGKAVAPAPTAEQAKTDAMRAAAVAAGEDA